MKYPARYDLVRPLPVATSSLSQAAPRRARVTRAPYREAAGEDQAASHHLLLQAANFKALNS
jgi:hypothetical protein